MKQSVIIVAGGKGLRMGGDLPKQFLPVGGKPVLMRAVEAFWKYNRTMQLIVVLPQDQLDLWKQLCKDHHFFLQHQVAEGGENRFQSVKNGLKLVDGPGLVGVHDGVRPFVSEEVISRCYAAAEKHKAVIPVMDVIETLRLITPNDESKTVNRADYRLVQTPQVFDADLLKKAYQQEYNASYTDEASVVEAMGVPIFLTEGNRENIKITTPFDLKVANALL